MIELLAGREAAPLAEWLTRHPGVEVICRDRSGSYAEGARLGAPGAVQVADRFHLWQNLAKATERCVARHRDRLRPPAPEQPEQPTAPAPAEEAPPVGRFAERARRHHALVDGLLAQGHGLRAIARHLGWGRHTVQRYARAVTWQELVDGRWRQPRPSKLDPFKPYLQQRWEQGCRNAAQLYREVGARGFAGSYALVRSYLDAYRVRPDPTAPPPPTVRQVTGWLTRHPDRGRPGAAQGGLGAVPGTALGRRPRRRLRRDAHQAPRPGAPRLDRRGPRRGPAWPDRVRRQPGQRPGRGHPGG